MKNLLFILACSFVLFSCGCGNNKVQQINNPSKIDSMSNDEKLTLVKKAYGSAEFGMSIEDVEKLPEFNNWEKYSSGILKSYEKIGLDQYDINLLFESNKKLYCVLIINNGHVNKSATDLDPITKADIMTFSDIISKTYGNPTMDYGFPNIQNLTPYQFIWVYQWEIETKTIQIGVEEYSDGDGPQYRMVAQIYNTPLYKEALAAHEKQVSKSASEGVDKL